MGRRTDDVFPDDPGGYAEAEARLATLAAALFPDGAADLTQLTWSDEIPVAGSWGRARAGQSDASDAEAKLRAAELRYRTLVEQIPAVTFMAALGEGDNEIYVSPHIEALLGFTQQEWLENPFLWYSQLHPDDRATWHAEFARGVRTGGPFRAECRFIGRDGRVVWVRGEARLIKDERGRPLFLQGIAFDITESKRAQAAALEEAIRGTEQRYRDLVEHLEAIFWEAELDTAHFTFVSGGAERILGFPAERWLADPEFWLTRVHDDDRAAVLAAWKQARESGSEAEFEFRAIAADGRQVWLQTRIQRPLVAAGERFLVGVMLDITERKIGDEERARLHQEAERARRAAEDASRAKDEFLATLSHELRTPLNALIGYAQLLRSNIFPPEFVGQALQRIERSAQTQSKLVEDLLDVSRIITGKLRLEAAPVDLAAVVDAAIEAVHLSADAKRLEMVYAIDRSGLVVMGDTNRLQQVVWNFLSNAVKYTPAGGRVTVRLERSDGTGRISVSDSGEGINPEFLPDVFDRFRQADSKVTRKHGGLGLGLSIVRHLVEAHGGSVWAESEGIGKGATFFAELPLATQGATGGPSETAPLAMAGPGGKLLSGSRILVIDDDEDARELLYALFSSAGATVTCAENGAAAMDALRTARPDVVVSDIGLPGEDGYHLLKRMRETPEGADVAAVSITAYAGPEYRRRAFEAGFQEHVTKPIDVNAILAVVARAAGKAGARENNTSLPRNDSSGVNR